MSLFRKGRLGEYPVGWSDPNAHLPTRYYPEEKPMRQASSGVVQLREETGIRDSNHALLVGEILGSLTSQEIDAEPVMVHGDYTNQVLIHRPSGDYRIVVEPVT